MPNDNLDRMIQLAEEFFETKNDPNQISVSEEVLLSLRLIHPATVSEKRTVDGPIAWVLILPTSRQLMEDFVAQRINERELLEKTPVGSAYDSIYLCSALVLPEERGKGVARELAVQAIRSIQRDHPITSLFYWPFSPEGERLAASIARHLNLPLRKRVGAPV